MSLTFLRQDQNTKDKYYLITDNPILNQVYFTIDANEVNAVEQHFQKLVNDLKEEYREISEDYSSADAMAELDDYEYVIAGFCFLEDQSDDYLHLQLSLCPDFELNPHWGVYFQLNKELAQQLIGVDQIKDVLGDFNQQTDQQVAILKNTLNQAFSEYFLNFLKEQK